MGNLRNDLMFWYQSSGCTAKISRYINIAQHKYKCRKIQIQILSPNKYFFLFHNHLEVIISELSAVCQPWDKVQVWPVLYSSFESWRLSILEKYKTPLMSDFIIWFDWYTTTIFDQLLKDIEFLLSFFIKGSRAGRVFTVLAIQKFPSNDCLGICSCFRNFRI